MWIREISDVEMDMLGFVPGQPKGESSSSSTSSQTKGGGDKLQALQGPGRIEGLGKNEIQSKEFKAALRGGGDAFLARLTPRTMSTPAETWGSAVASIRSRPRCSCRAPEGYGGAEGAGAQACRGAAS
jgi:hypothetical protein